MLEYMHKQQKLPKVFKPKLKNVNRIKQVEKQKIRVK